jgi:hypothetical protein
MSVCLHGTVPLPEGFLWNSILVIFNKICCHNPFVVKMGKGNALCEGLRIFMIYDRNQCFRFRYSLWGTSWSRCRLEIEHYQLYVFAITISRCLRDISCDVFKSEYSRVSTMWRCVFAVQGLGLLDSKNKDPKIFETSGNTQGTMYQRTNLESVATPLWELQISYCNSLDKWVLVTTTWSVLRLRMEERLPMWRVAANILNKQSRTAATGLSSSLGVGRGANNSWL